MAKCEIRSREVQYRKWDGSKGYFSITPALIYEVFVEGEPEAVASSEEKKVAETVAEILSAVPLQDVSAILEAISKPALTRSAALRRHEPAPAYDPTARHSTAS